MSREPKKLKSRCAECKFVDTSAGTGSWSCASPRAHAETKTPLPRFFPRVFTNDVCAHWVDSGRRPEVVETPGEPAP